VLIRGHQGTHSRLASRARGPDEGGNQCSSGVIRELTRGWHRGREGLMRGAISAHQGSSLVIAGARACSEKVACPGRRVSSPSHPIRATHRQSVVIMANQRSSARLLGKVAVADLASSRRAVAPHLAHRKGREDVLQVEALPLLAIEVLVPDEEGHWASSGVIGRHQRSSEVIRRHQWQSVAISVPRHHRISSEVIRRHQ
jgi:hypothetical protein